MTYVTAQRHCINRKAAAGEIAYCEDESTVKQISGGRSFGPDWSIFHGLSGEMAPFMRTDELSGRTWDGSGISVLVMNGGASLILCKATAPGCSERIVKITLDPQFTFHALDKTNTFPALHDALEWTVSTPATNFCPPAVLKSGAWVDPKFNLQLKYPLTIYTGRRDPNDASHFTIAFKTPKEMGTVDGRLLKDDRIEFQVIPAMSHNDAATAPTTLR